MDLPTGDMDESDVESGKDMPVGSLAGHTDCHDEDILSLPWTDPSTNHSGISVLKQNWLKQRRCRLVLLTAATALADTNWILKIHPWWLKQIMSGEKKTEIRGKKFPHPGWVSLAATRLQETWCRAKLGNSHLMTESEIGHWKR